MIVATAGHVDHGKTTLVRALTGIDTDRLPEEKRRGMSIDLGFAYLPAGEGLPIAFVDVPGHERFVRNMVAGVQAIDLALLVVAADDGPMPQTHEHLAILRHLGVHEVWVVLSKLDRVEAARAAAVRSEVSGFGTRVFEGPAGLKEALQAKAKEIRRSAEGLFRMHVDRSFVLDGIGVVATGTITHGTVRAGDTLTLLPAGTAVRVRTVRANNTESGAARAGERAALGLHGVSREELRRGDVLAAGARLPRSRRIDVAVDFKAKRQVLAHFGTQAAPAAFSKLGEGLARLTFSEDVVAWHGERMILRDPATGALFGGATVLDALPPIRRATRPERLSLLERLRGASAQDALQWMLESGSTVDLDWLAANWHLSDPPPVKDARRLGKASIVSEARWEALKSALLASVGRHHRDFPEQPGQPLSALRAAFALEYGRALLDAALQDAFATGALERWGTHVRLPGHRVALSAAEQALWEKVAPLLEADSAKPARVFELAEALALPPKDIEAFLLRASLAGLAVRVARNRFFTPAAVERMVALARELDGPAGFSAAQFRDRSALGRNLTIEVLEFLDQSGYTKRRGDLRHLSESNTEEERTPVGRTDFKSAGRRPTPPEGSTPSSSAITPR